MEYARRREIISSARQRVLLEAAGIPADVFGDAVDPSSFVAIAALEAGANGFDLRSVINKGQTVSMTRQIRVDEALSLTGNLSESSDKDGSTAISRVTLSDEAGNACLYAVSTLFRPSGPARRSGPRQRPGMNPGVTDPDGLRRVETARFTPEAVRTFAGESANPIHTDPDAARAAGFRAPIIGGAHGVAHLTAAIWRTFRVEALDFEVSFRRPVFWDDECEVAVHEQNAEWLSVCLLRNGRIATELRILTLRPGISA